MADDASYRLTIDLTPRFMSSAALRKKISGYRWKEIKRNLVTERGLVCEICRNSVLPQKWDAHEAFIYPDDGSVRLDAIQVLCKSCHAIKDFAQTERLIEGGVFTVPNYREILIEWFCRENRCCAKDFEAHYETARKRAEELDERYGPNMAQDRINYGAYHSYYLKAQDPERFKTHTAASHAIANLIKNGVHEDYREVLLEITSDDPKLSEEILRLVKAGDQKAARTRLLEELEDYFSEDAPIDEDQAIPWRRLGRSVNSR